MERVHRFRVSKISVAVLVFVLVAFDSPPSTPAIPEVPVAPLTAEQIDAIAELSQWVLGGSSAPRFEAFKERSLDVVSERPMGFELFREFYSPDSRVDALKRLPFGDLILNSARRREVDPLLLASIIEAESSFDPEAVSAVGAQGLMQLMPSTLELYSDGDPMDPRVSIDVGARYLADLLEQFEGDVALALAAYNAGPGNVRKHRGVPPFSETRHYVERVMSRYIDYHQEVWESDPDRAWFL